MDSIRAALGCERLFASRYTVVGIALEAIEKRYGVPILVSFGGLFAVCMGVIWWRDRARRLGR